MPDPERTQNRAPSIGILGVYRVALTQELFEHAMEWKYGDFGLSEEKRRQAEDVVRDELASVVLIEVSVTNRDSRFDVGHFGQPGSDQVAYDESFLSLDGASVLSKLHAPEVDPLRLAFFMHFFDPDKPLVTTYGELPVPPVQEMPERLRQLMPYVPVD